VLVTSPCVNKQGLEEISPLHYPNLDPRKASGLRRIAAALDAW
jgi:hypothetical protein